MDPATVVGATLRWPIARGFTLAGGLRNLFDQAYADPASEEHTQQAIGQDGRTAHVSLEWRFATP